MSARVLLLAAFSLPAVFVAPAPGAGPSRPAIPLPGLGLFVAPRASPDCAKVRDLEGWWVLEVTPGSPADRAGLRAADRILGVSPGLPDGDEYLLPRFSAPHRVYHLLEGAGALGFLRRRLA